MCGISALYQFTKVTAEDVRKLEKMNSQMAYRGPDGEGYWHNDRCALAHTRLSIIGLNNGAQPLYNADKSIVLVCNGEIYNYKELRLHIAGKGYHYTTESDCEVIIYLYELYGEKCLEYLRGPFAFALYDTKKDTLFVARDRIGEKTLYYAQLPTGIVFSTELKAILKNFVPHPEIDMDVLATCIRYNYPTDLRHTWIKQIQRVQQGEYGIVDKDGLHLHTYWKRLHRSSVSANVMEEEAVEEIRRLMKESVHLCMHADVPVAVMLSGGIDSTSIAHYAKESGHEVHVLSAGYKGNFAVDERQTAKRFADENGLIYHDIELDTNDFASLFEEEMQFVDEPCSDVSSMSQYAIYKKAREMGFKVILSGVGGDEQFYSYPWDNRIAQALMTRSEHLRLLPWRKNKAAYLQFVLLHWKYLLLGTTERDIERFPVDWTYDDYNRFAKSATIDGIPFADIDTHVYPLAMDSPAKLYDFVFSRFMTTLCLYNSDRLGMAAGVEVRCPLLDYKLVEYISNLPDKLKFRVNESKHLQKKAMEGILPDYILHAPKRGFEPPFDFIREMNRTYQYRHIQSDHVFFNSMLADTLIDNLLK